MKPPRNWLKPNAAGVPAIVTVCAIAANVAKFQPYFDEGRRQLRTELAPVALYPVVQVGIRIPR
jgi:hypothetical protein